MNYLRHTKIIHCLLEAEWKKFSMSQIINNTLMLKAVHLPETYLKFTFNWESWIFSSNHTPRTTNPLAPRCLEVFYNPPHCECSWSCFWARVLPRGEWEVLDWETEDLGSQVLPFQQLGQLPSLRSVSSFKCACSRCKACRVRVSLPYHLPQPVHFNKQRAGVSDSDSCSAGGYGTTSSLLRA
jgi:hypothetical protein